MTRHPIQRLRNRESSGERPPGYAEFILSVGRIDGDYVWLTPEQFQSIRDRFSKWQGLGDAVEAFTKATGIKRLVGDCNGCRKRRAKLNQLFPNPALDKSKPLTYTKSQ